MTDASQRYNVESGSADATFALGQALGRSLVGGLTIGLIGPLGAGKTHLVKGVAAGNGVVDVRKVTSPTFTLVHEYPGRLTLYHADLYRLHGSRELIALGFDEWIRSDAVVVIEWVDHAPSVVPDEALWIELTPTGCTTRSVSFRASGDAAIHCLEDLRTRLDTM